MNKTTLLAAALAGLMMGGTAMAQGYPGGGPHGDRSFGEERFAELDTNGDGRVTRAEVEAKIAEDFASADQDGNGTLDQEEAEAFHQARHEERRERMREHRGDRHFERRAGDDDAIDREEFGERGMDLFERVDLDENGEVTQTEMNIVANLMELRHEGRGGHRGGHHGGWDRD